MLSYSFIDIFMYCSGRLLSVQETKEGVLIVP